MSRNGDYPARYIAETRGLARLPTALRILLAVALTAFAFASSGVWWQLAALAGLLVLVYLGSGLLLRHLLRDLRPPSWQLPLVVLLYTVLPDAGGPLAGLAVSTQVVCALLPSFWLLRVTSVDSFVTTFQRVLPRRLALLLGVSLRFLPTLSRELRDIVLVQRLRGCPVSWHTLYRPRAWPTVLQAVLIPAIHRTLCLCRETEWALRSRGIVR